MHPRPPAGARGDQAGPLGERQRAQGTPLAKYAHYLKQISMGKRKVYTNHAATAIARQAYKKMSRDKRQEGKRL